MSFEAILEVLGYSDTSNHYIAERVRKIAKLVKVKPGVEGFEEAVQQAETTVLAQGNSAFASFVGAVTAPPKEREYKIKRSEKGHRIGIKSASGKNFSFGPIWNDSIRACKGIVLVEQNREKLNMHGTHLGVAEPEKMSARELCSAIAALL